MRAQDIADKYGIFQLTTSRRGRLPHLSYSVTTSNFQLTTSRRGRLATAASDFAMSTFNSRPHEEVDKIPEACLSRLSFFQLTTSRRGRLVSADPFVYDDRLSTHDLTKRSTANIHNYLEYLHLLSSILYKPFPII